MKNNNGPQEDRVDELVEMIDRLMAQGDGRVTVKADEFSAGMQVSTYRTTDCGESGAKGACCQPTELDDEDGYQKG